MNKSYWVIESIVNGQILYWTGHNPSWYEDESRTIWTPDIHKAIKFAEEQGAVKEKSDFEVNGEVKEHMDIANDYENY